MSEDEESEGEADITIYDDDSIEKSDKVTLHY